MSELREFCDKKPPKAVREALIEDRIGKLNYNVYFHIELVFQLFISCVIPPICIFFINEEISNLHRATPLFHCYSSAHETYANANANPKYVRGYDMYKNFKDKADFHRERIHLASAALFQLDFKSKFLSSLHGRITYHYPWSATPWI